MADRIGLVGGTVFHHQDFFKEAEKEKIETSFGPAMVVLTDRLVYVPRHGMGDDLYILPHKINHPANFSALKKLEVTEVIGINSTGSLKISLSPGTVVLPHDYICFSGVATAVQDKSKHIIPTLSQEVRSRIKAAAEATGVELVDRGVYWQTPGPRLETQAEIKLLADYADIVGMTMASEAMVAQELGLEYASICSVDNYAHGLSPTPLKEGEIGAKAAANAEKIYKIVQAYLDLKPLK
ncbi:MAG: MTAP family purine nucleoside phosphorylase [Deltaproteobacteria bacterium]|nr:MTAP family purine nucleoside phosphorylase [Deltaproteobacteria bacterium]MBW2086756.1 MTAP family purine nucleoside phosphorylase [Deltaproteobacteria bacterium]